MERMRIQILIVFTLLLTLSCNNKKSKEPFCVTYEVSFIPEWSEALSISYKDSTGLNTVILNEGIWSKKVCLAPDNHASLLVQTIHDFKNKNTWMNAQVIDPSSKHRNNNPIGVRIIHPQKQVADKGNGALYLILLSTEVAD